MKDCERPIGVFDSGMGGISVLANLIHAMPNEEFIYYGDSKNAPYGIKNVNDIRDLSINICDFLVEEGVKAIVVACNTATSAAINDIRKKYDIHIVGMEPALKPAVEINKDNKTIIVMATETTLKEKKFEQLMIEYGKNSKIDKMPASKLVDLVERDMNDTESIKKYLNSLLEGYDMNEVSSIVLGCTHFIFIKDILKDIVSDNVTIIDGNIGTTNHLIYLLNKTDQLNHSSNEGSVKIYNSTNNEDIIEYSRKLLLGRIEKLNDKVV